MAMTALTASLIWARWRSTCVATLYVLILDFVRPWRAAGPEVYSCGAAGLLERNARGTGRYPVRARPLPGGRNRWHR